MNRTNEENLIKTSIQALTGKIMHWCAAIPVDGLTGFNAGLGNRKPYLRTIFLDLNIAVSGRVHRIYDGAAV